MSNILKASLFLLLLAFTVYSTPTKEKEPLLLALDALTLAKTRALALSGLNTDNIEEKAQKLGPWVDCAELYANSEARIRRLLTRENYDMADSSAWLSSALTGHATCLAGLAERNMSVLMRRHREVEAVLRSALASLPARRNSGEYKELFDSMHLLRIFQPRIES